MEGMKEYGGYLPIELNHTGGYFDEYSDHMVMLQCGRMAVEYVLKDTRVDKLYLPRYLCPSVLSYLKNSVEIVLYDVDESFEPIDVTLQINEYLFWVNFFGLASVSQQKSILERYKNVIFDNTQAFYAKPFLSAYNIYSCRKFFGVSDGAYLIRGGIGHYNLERNYGYETGAFLLKSLEKGTNEAYTEYLANEERFEQSGIKEMSVLTQRIMNGIDYMHIAEQRRQNFRVLHERLGSYNELAIDLQKDVVPMVYPLLITNKKLRQYLVKNKVYVSQWWKAVLDDLESNAFERRLSEYLLPLPIDQRYTENDMEEIARLVSEGI